VLNKDWSIAMCVTANVYRERAKFVEAGFTADSDQAMQRQMRQIARGYEQLAINEEWLSGEIPPYAANGHDRR